MWTPHLQGRRYIALAMLGAGIAAPGGAATFTVDTTADTVAVDPATSPKDAGGRVSLRSAIMAANAQAGPDKVILTSGAIHTLTLGPTDSALGALNDKSGDLDITDDLTLYGNGATVDAGGIDRAFAIERADLQDFTVTIEGLAVRGGAPKGFLSPGGGISVRAATLDMRNCYIVGNTTVAAGSNGGGIAANGVRFPAASMAKLTLTDCTVAANAANNGGGILAGDCLLTLSGCRVQDNQAVGTDAGTGGGNLFLTGEATEALISNSTIAGGTGAADGGGLSLFTAGLQIENSTVSGNAANRDGGGLYVSGMADLRNTTVSGNSAAGGGGLAGPGSAFLLNVTVAHNTAGMGGGLLSSGAMVVRNTMVANNSASAGPDVNGPLASLGYNLIGDSTGLIFNGDLTGNLANVAPLFGPLADNGGPTRTHALLVGSPALDAASPSVYPLADQRGVLRPQDGDGISGARADIGAFELLPPYVVAEVVRALRIAGGLLPASDFDLIRLDVGGRDGSIRVADAIRLARKAAGTEANP